MTTRIRRARVAVAASVGAFTLACALAWLDPANRARLARSRTESALRRAQAALAGGDDPSRWAQRAADQAAGWVAVAPEDPAARLSLAESFLRKAEGLRGERRKGDRARAALEAAAASEEAVRLAPYSALPFLVRGRAFA